MNTASILASDLVSNLKAALCAASTDETRAHMNSVLIELDPKGTARFVATNGHWIWINECRLIDNPAPTARAEILLRVSDVKAIIKGLDVKSLNPAVTIDLDTATITQNAFSYRYTVQNCVQFPPYVQVIRVIPQPSNAMPVLSSDLLASVSAAFSCVAVSDKAKRGKGWIKRTPGVRLEPCGGNLDPVAATADAAPDAFAILMPFRDDSLSRVAQHVARYTATPAVVAPTVEAAAE